MPISRQGFLELCDLIGVPKGESKKWADEVYQPKLLEKDEKAQKVLAYLKEHGLRAIVHPSYIRKAAKETGIEFMDFIDMVILLEDCGILESTFLKADCDNVKRDKTISQK